MIDFGGVTHLSENPAGHKEGWNYRFVGAVPIGCLEPRTPTRADVMGGRVRPDGLAYYDRRLATVDEALDLAREAGAVLCSAPGCACRSLF